MKIAPYGVYCVGALAATVLLGGCAGAPAPDTAAPNAAPPATQPLVTSPANQTSEPASPAPTPPPTTQVTPAATDQPPTATAQPAPAGPTLGPTGAPAAPAAEPSPGSRNAELPAAAQAAADLASADLARRLGVDASSIELLGAQPRRRATGASDTAGSPDGWVIRLASGSTAYTYQVDAAGRVVGRNP